MNLDAQLWASICELFAEPHALPLDALTRPQQVLVEALKRLGAVRLQPINDDHILCPNCRMSKGRLVAPDPRWPDALYCQCPRCGLMLSHPEERMRMRLDPQWLARAVCDAHQLPAGGVHELLPDTVWRLGVCSDRMLLLSRHLQWLWEHQILLTRLQARAARPVCVLAPKPASLLVPPGLMGVHWLPLQQSFALREGRLARIDCGLADEPASQPVADDPVHGPFSHDFRTVHLAPWWSGGPIALTIGQAALFRALWQLRERPRYGGDIMRQAHLRSDRPSDLFKGRRKNDPQPGAAAFAYRLLVETDQHTGTYQLVWPPRQAKA
jgi:hypothetical protein